MLTFRRKHVVVHTDHHRDEHDRVVKEVQFDPREDQLQNAARYWFSPKIVVKRGLPDQQKMLNVMPELNPERDHPPRVRNSGKALPEHPKTDQHHQGVAVVQGFGLD